MRYYLMDMYASDYNDVIDEMRVLHQSYNRGRFSITVNNSSTLSFVKVVGAGDLTFTDPCVLQTYTEETQDGCPVFTEPENWTPALTDGDYDYP